MAHAQEVPLALQDPQTPAHESSKSSASSLEDLSAFMPLSRTLRNFTTVVIATILIVFPLCFGGVHPTTVLVERILVFGSLLLLFLYARERIEAVFASSPSSRRVIYSLIALSLYVAMLALGRELIAPAEHAVLGSAPRGATWTQTWLGIESLLSFLAMFTLVRAWLGDRQQKADLLIFLVLLAGSVVALTALSHWFYDNGKLFWFFEPEHVFRSERARWPFVNSNHLASFLLPAFFISLALLIVNLRELRSLAVSVQRANKRSWGLLLSSHRIQRRLIRLGFLLAIALGSALAISGSLSRANWFAVSVMLLPFAFLRKLFPSSSATLTSPQSLSPLEPAMGSADSAAVQSDTGAEEEPETSRSRQARRAMAARRKHSPLSSEDILQAFDRLGSFAAPLLGVLACALFLIFLYGRGTELFLDRLEYGLMFSHEDIRWQLYRDTFPMLQEHLWFGVGLGAWSSYLPQYMSAQITGVEPVYLHSDPYQLLVETGTFGVIMTLLFLVPVGTQVLRALGKSPGITQLQMFGILIGLIAIGVASLFDFPFRIPAISSLTAALLALLIFFVDKRRSNTFGDGATFHGS